MIQEGIRGTGQESVGKGSLSLPGMVPMAMKTNPLNLSLLYQGEGGRDEEIFNSFCIVGNLGVNC